MEIKTIRDYQHTQTIAGMIHKLENKNQHPPIEELLQTLRRVETKLDVLLMQRPRI